MKKDIDFPSVSGVSVAIVRSEIEHAEYEWKVCLLNSTDDVLHNVLVVSKGYGFDGKEEQKTSILRHLIEEIQPKSAADIERIDPTVFHLFNEYWVSYYIDRKIYDKKFLFVPESIIEENVTNIPGFQLEGILHH